MAKRFDKIGKEFTKDINEFHKEVLKIIKKDGRLKVSVNDAWMPGVGSNKFSDSPYFRLEVEDKQSKEGAIYTYALNQAWNGAAVFKTEKGRGPVRLGDIGSSQQAAELIIADFGFGPNESTGNVGPYLAEHDSEIISRDKGKTFEVTLFFVGEHEDDLAAGLFIEHPNSDSYEEWEIKGDWSVDDAFRIGSKAKVEPSINVSHNNFSATIKGDGARGAKIYQAAEKYFRGKMKKNKKRAEIKL